jgi:hypothetical protein
LLRHLKARWLKCRREAPAAAAKAAPKPVLDANAQQVVEVLKRTEKNKRPRKRKTLTNYLVTPPCFPVHASGTLTITPVAGAPGLVGYRQHECFVAVIEDDDVEGESLEHQSHCASFPSSAGHWRQRDNLLLQQIKCRLDSCVEFPSQSGAL